MKDSERRGEKKSVCVRVGEKERVSVWDGVRGIECAGERECTCKREIVKDSVTES